MHSSTFAAATRRASRVRGASRVRQRRPRLRRSPRASATTVGAVLKPPPALPRAPPPPGTAGAAASHPAPAWNGRGGGFALGKCGRKPHACIVRALALQGRGNAYSIIDGHESSERKPLRSNGHTINLSGNSTRGHNANPPPLPSQAFSLPRFVVCCVRGCGVRITVPDAPRFGARR